MQLVLPRCYIKEVPQEVHNGIYHGHLGEDVGKYQRYLQTLLGQQP